MTEKLTIGEIAQKAFEAEVELARLNKAKKDAKADKDKYRALLDVAMEQNGLNDVGTPPNEDGKRTLFYYVDKPHFDIMDRGKVIEWAQTEDEAYVDPEPALRESLIFQECRRRREEGLPLPPGIAVRSEKELHKRTI